MHGVFIFNYGTFLCFNEYLGLTLIIRFTSSGKFLLKSCSLCISITPQDISSFLATVVTLSRGRAHHCNKTGITGFLWSWASCVSLIKLSECKYFWVIHITTTVEHDICSWINTPAFPVVCVWVPHMWYSQGLAKLTAIALPASIQDSQPWWSRNSLILPTLFCTSQWLLKKTFGRSTSGFTSKPENIGNVYLENED